MQLDIDIANWIPKRDGIYRYEGSLTTPNFDEVVSWVVYKEPLQIGHDDVDGLLEYFDDPALSPQPINRRRVLNMS